MPKIICTRLTGWACIKVNTCYVLVDGHKTATTTRATKTFICTPQHVLPVATSHVASIHQLFVFRVIRIKSACGTCGKKCRNRLTFRCCQLIGATVCASVYGKLLQSSTYCARGKWQVASGKLSTLFNCNVKIACGMPQMIGKNCNFLLCLQLKATRFRSCEKK